MIDNEEFPDETLRVQPPISLTEDSVGVAMGRDNFNLIVFELENAMKYNEFPKISLSFYY